MNALARNPWYCAAVAIVGAVALGYNLAKPDYAFWERISVCTFDAAMATLGAVGAHRAWGKVQ